MHRLSLKCSLLKHRDFSETHRASLVHFSKVAVFSWWAAGNVCDLSLSSEIQRCHRIFYRNALKHTDKYTRRRPL